MKTRKVPISEKALYQRINRKLQDRGESLKRARAGVVTTLGEYYVVDLRGNYVSKHHIGIEDFGRELDVLAEWESLS
jgi:hypothetical protein